MNTINPLYIKWSVIGAMVGSLSPILIYNMAHYMEKYNFAPEFAPEIVQSINGALTQTVAGDRNTETFLGKDMVKPTPQVTPTIAEITPIATPITEPKPVESDYSKYSVKVTNTNLTIPKELGKINKPNFAGSYYILGVGCKPKCEGYKIYNLTTGESFGNLKISNERNDVTGIRLHYKVNSKLLVANTYDKNNVCSAREFLFENNSFTPLTTKISCNEK